MTMPNPPDDGPPQIPLALSYYIRVASRSDLRKLEWYGSQSHTLPYIEQAYKAMLAGRRIMIVADLNDLGAIVNIEPKKIITFPNAGHADHWMFGSYDAINSWIDALRAGTEQQ